MFQEFFWMALFFLRWEIMFGPMIGFWSVYFLYLCVRFLESHWFFWATQMSHIPMYINYDQKTDWVTTQVKASCNVEHSLFNDWWSGHLNFQIEHHLFPTMPRNNLVKVAPLVKSMCEKHNLDYPNKPLWTALGDIVRQLKTSGEIWYDAYYNS
jgi:fatty acid desaturase